MKYVYDVYLSRLVSDCFLPLQKCRRTDIKKTSLSNNQYELRSKSSHVHTKGCATKIIESDREQDH